MNFYTEMLAKANIGDTRGGRAMMEGTKAVLAVNAKCYQNSVQELVYSLMKIVSL